MDENNRFGSSPTRLFVSRFYALAKQGVTNQFFSQALNLLLPASCLACRQQTDQPGQALGLCSSCAPQLEYWPAGCPICGQPGPAQTCPKCTAMPPALSRIVSAFTYQPPLDRVVTAMKFDGLDYLGEQLGEALADQLDDAVAGLELICPVPLHWTRRWRRGFDQALEIARGVGDRRGLPVRSLLRRSRATRAQSSLGRAARRYNLHDAFIVRRPARVRGRKILLVDDVYTTGATLQAAAKSLLAGGAEKVVAATVARTPLEHERQLTPEDTSRTASLEPSRASNPAIRPTRPAFHEP